MQTALNLVPDTNDIQSKTLTTTEHAHALDIQNGETYLQAAEMLKTIKGLLKEVKATFKPIKEKSWASHQENLRQEERHQTPLLEAEKTLKGKIAKYNEEQEKKRIEAEKILQEEQRKKAEEEQLDQALQAEKDGDKQVAEQILNQPTNAPVAVLPDAVPQVKGISIKQNWNFRITNPGLIPDEYKKIDQVAIRKVVTALGGKTKIPGVQPYVETNVAASVR